ncbi:hypothetical protein HK097_006439 [Rhizophlyctis rosea]|uniref:Enoyl reductase (ER) domain-containing protein n=1 Tax=Rhizophlyctis rosea TaxID=64517 RepID=A0AAD5SDC9_9FUNG|nr:hypothetical protein HK097_006439 [Rhizophlyctis rosea]
MEDSVVNNVVNGCCHVNLKEKNLGLVLKGPEDRKLALEEVPVREPKDHEVLIRMKNVGICGSDVHYVTHGRIGHFVVEADMILGHEGAGIIAQVGKNVKGLKVGDKVAVEPGVPCRSCEHCIEGNYNLCPDVAFCATPPYDGDLRVYFTYDAKMCYKLPAHVSLEEGALLEPLAVGVHACSRAGVGIGDRVLITGAGPIGCMAVVVAKAAGASEIIVTDISASRLEFIKSLGATNTINVVGRTGEDVAEQVKILMDGNHPNKSIECSGAESGLHTCVMATRPGGTIVVVGMGAPVQKIALAHATIAEQSILGSFRYGPTDYARALNLVASGAVKVKPLVTHRFKLEESEKAFELAKTGGEGVVKIMIEV